VPPYLNNLCAILLRFHSHAFALATDIELTYRFAVILSSSLSTLATVLDLHLGKSTSPVAADTKQNIYVDNILSGCNTEDELLTYNKPFRQHMSQVNFNLWSWSSNSRCLQAVTARDKTNDPHTTVGLLGLHWNTITDTVSLEPRQLSSTNTSLITKRDILLYRLGDTCQCCHCMS